MAEEQIILEFVGQSNGLKEFLDGLEQGITEEVQAIQKANKEFQTQDKSVKTLTTDVDKLGKSFNDISKGIAGGAMKQGAENVAKVANNVTKATGETQKLTTQLRALREQLSKLDEGSAEFERLSIEAGKLQDRIGDISQRIRALSSDTFAIDALVDTARAAAGAFSIAQGAAALFGDENEDLQKALLKVQASLAILNGLQETSAFLTGQSAGKIAIVNAAQKAYTFVTNGATLATRAFNAALVGLGAGAVIAGVIFLISKIKDLGAETKKTSDEADEATKRYRELQKVADDFLRGQAANLVNIDKIRERIFSGTALGAEETVRIIEELQTVSENYFGELKAGESTIKDIATALNNYKEALNVRAQLEAARKELEPYSVELLKLKEAAKDATGSISVDYGRLNQLSFTIIPELTKNIENLEAKLRALGGDPTEAAKKVKEQLEKINKEVLKFSVGDVSEGQLPLVEDAEKSIGLVGDLQARLSKLNEAIPTAKTVEELNNIRLAIALVQQELDKLLNPTVEGDSKPPLFDYGKYMEERIETIKKAIIAATQEVSDAIFNISNQRRQDELNADLAALNQRKEAELANKELTEAGRANIEAKYRNQERQLRIRAFNQEKQAKIAQAIMNGALAISQTIATVPKVIPGTVLPNPQFFATLALIGITTAAQVATITAQRPPAFKKGTKSAPGGMALVGEEGAELVHLPRGAKVVPHSETMKVLSGHPDTNDILSRFNIPFTSPKIGALKESFVGFDYERFEKILQKNRPQSQVIFDKQGIITIVNDEGSRRTYLGERYSSR